MTEFDNECIICHQRWQGVHFNGSRIPDKEFVCPECASAGHPVPCLEKKTKYNRFEIMDI